jgi:hypothetical protein
MLKRIIIMKCKFYLENQILHFSSNPSPGVRGEPEILLLRVFSHFKRLTNSSLSPTNNEHYVIPSPHPCRILGQKAEMTNL